MRKYILFIVFLLLIPVYLWATDGVNTVEHPAKVNSVATPDKVNTVSGLAVAGSACSGNYGDTAIEGSLDKVSPDGTDDGLVVYKITLDCSGTSSDMYGHFRYANQATREVRFVVYSDNAGEPNTLLYTGNAVYDAGADSGGGWVHDSDAYAFPSSGDYWVGVIGEYADTYFCYGTQVGSKVRQLDDTDFTPPNTWDTENDLERDNTEASFYVIF